MVKIAVYIDETGSMKESMMVSGRQMSKVQIAKEIWNQAIVPVISDHNSRVRSIDSKNASRELLPLGYHPSSSLDSLAFRDSGRSTYMWEFLVNEASNFGQDDDWVVVLISDGEDNASPSPYKGLSGLKPCIDDIRAMGHNPDFHIIGLNLKEADASARSSLSGATGGLFLNVTTSSNLADVFSQIKTTLEEHIGDDREIAIRKKQDAYASSPEARSGDGPDIVYRDKDTIPSSRVVSRYGRGLDSLTHSNNKLIDWHLRVLALLHHVQYGDKNQKLVESWTRPNIKKKHWKSLALDYGDLARLDPSDLLDLIRVLMELNDKHKNLKVLVRSGAGGKNRDVENFLKTLKSLGIEIILLPKSFPSPLPFPNDPDSPWIPGGDADFDVKGDSDWNFIPSDKAAPCRRFLMVQPIISRSKNANRIFERLGEECADFPHICQGDREFLETLGEDCRGYFHDIDLDLFGRILVQTLNTLFKCYHQKRVMKQIWFIIPEKAIRCGIRHTRQWLSFLAELKRIIENGPYPLDVFINGEILE